MLCFLSDAKLPVSLVLKITTPEYRENTPAENQSFVDKQQQ